MSDWTVIYYKTVAGKCPVREYLDGLEIGEAARVTFDIDLLEDFGLNLGAPYVRNLRGKIWELRTSGRVQHRILYFAVAGKRLVLLHAFTKKTRKTPPEEIDAAERRMTDYLARRDDDEA